MSAALLLQTFIQGSRGAGIQADIAGHTDIQIKDRRVPILFFYPLDNDAKIVFHCIDGAYPSASAAVNTDGRINFVRLFFLSCNCLGRADIVTTPAADTRVQYYIRHGISLLKIFT
jgi:hypothetical protein